MTRLFSNLYRRVMQWSRHPHAVWYLSGLSFAESSFFPIPPDVMLAPMSMAHPQRAWWYAFVTTCFSVCGGLFGYLLGYFFFALVHPLLIQWGYQPLYQQVVTWFDHWGIWVLFIAGFTPVPYKIFTIASGVVAMHLIPFVLVSFLARGARFFLVAGLMRWGGARMEALIMRFVDRIAWVCILLLLLIYIVWQFNH